MLLLVLQGVAGSVFALLVLHRRGRPLLHRGGDCEEHHGDECETCRQPDHRPDHAGIDSVEDVPATAWWPVRALVLSLALVLLIVVAAVNAHWPSPREASVD